MQRLMQTNCAVFRTDKLLAEGVSKIDDVDRSLGDLKVNDRSMVWNSDLVEALELENLLAQAVTIPIYGRLADLYGRKRVCFAGTSVFLLGSFLCGCA